MIFPTHAWGSTESGKSETQELSYPAITTGRSFHTNLISRHQKQVRENSSSKHFRQFGLSFTLATRFKQFHALSDD